MNEAENKKEYEVSYLLTPEIPEDKIDSEVAELKNIINKNGGDIVQTNPLEKKRLAYLVKKQNQVYFGIVYFNIDKDGLDKIKKTLALYKKILRFVILTHSTSSGLMLSKVEALSKVIKPKSIIEAVKKSAETPAPTQSFDQKLENILKG